MSNDGTGLRERLLAAADKAMDSGYETADSRLLREAATALSAVAPPPVLEGWKLVPLEPTDEMVDAAWDSEAIDYVGEHKRIHSASISYRAMLAASPAAPALHWERIDPTARWITHDFSDNQLPKYFCIKSAQPGGGAFEQWWERVGDEYYSGGMTGLDIAEAAWKAAAAQPEGGEAVLVMRECMRCGLSHPAEDRAWSDAVAKHLGDTGYGPPFTDVLQNVEACIRATVRLWTKDAARPAHAQHAVTDTPVAWSLDGFIHDEDGRAIGTDETQIHWGSENPDPEAGWQPLYDRPAASLQVTDEMVERALAARYDDGSVRDWFVWADFADHDCDSIIRAALTAAITSTAAKAAEGAK